MPGVSRRTVREILVHLHNARCRWIKTLGREHGITAPVRVDQRSATPRQLAVALKQSSMGIEALLNLGLASGGEMPPSKGYVWRNLPLDVWHVLATSSPTRRITADRSSSLPGRPDSGFRRPSSMASGGGKNPKSRHPTDGRK